jgi:hypothetical protein
MSGEENPVAVGATVYNPRDPRYALVGQILGIPRQMVIGIIVDVWSYCAERGERVLRPAIIDALAERKGFVGAMVDADLAEVTPDGVLVREEREGALGWYQNLRDGDAKRNGGRARSATAQRDETGKFLPKKSSSAQQAASTVPAQPATNTNTKIKEEEKKNKNLKGAAPAAAPFVAAYVKAFQGRYGKNVRPHLAGKVVGEIQAFLRDVTLEEAIPLIEAYCRMPEPWFEKKAHDFTTFAKNVGKVSVWLAQEQGGEARPDDTVYVAHGGGTMPVSVAWVRELAADKARRGGEMPDLFWADGVRIQGGDLAELLGEAFDNAAGGRAC